MTVHPTIYVPLCNLSPDKKNPRKTVTGAAEDAMLRASIETHGLLHPLTVWTGESDGYVVKIGSRRLGQLVAIHGAEAAVEVPCVVRDDLDEAGIREAAVAENLARVGFNAADEFEVFAAMAKGGKGDTIEAIALHFGVRPLYVKQRLALGNLDKSVLRKLRDGTLPLDAAMALTLTTDKTLQRDLVKQTAQQYNPAAHIRRALSGQKIAVTTAIFDLDRYQGTITRDLFADEADAGTFDDTAQVLALQREAAEAKVQSLLEDGWKWAEFHVDLSWQGREGYPGRGRWENPDKYSQADKEALGVLIVLETATAKVTTYAGRLHPDDLRAEKRRAKADTQAAASADPTAEPGSAWAGALVADIDSMRAIALQGVLAAPASLRLAKEALLLQTLCGALGGTRMNTYLGTDWANDQLAGSGVAAIRAAAFDSLKTLLDINPAKASYVTTSAVYRRLRDLTDAQVDQLVAITAALTVSPADAEIAADMLARAGVHLSTEWRPDAAFFGRLNKTQMQVIGNQLDGMAGTHAAVVAKGKKSEAVAYMAGVFSAPEQSPAVTSWLPEQMLSAVLPAQTEAERMAAAWAAGDEADDLDGTGDLDGTAADAGPVSEEMNAAPGGDQSAAPAEALTEYQDAA